MHYKKECGFLKRVILLVIPRARMVIMIAWIHQPVKDKMEFIRLQLSYLDVADADTRRCALLCLAHLAQGI